MKTIGLLGGMSWESSREYYRILNQEVNSRLGGSSSASCLLYSFNFTEIEQLQERGDWGKLARKLTETALKLEEAGAELLLICANTMHRVVPEIEGEIDIPILHIADAAGQAVREKGLNRVGLMGTRYVMEGSFYRERLREMQGLEVLVPEAEERQLIHRVIYRELVRGELKEESRQRLLEIVDSLVERGAGGVILGCTELPLLLTQSVVRVPVFDTTGLHARAAVDFALQG